MKIPPFRRTNKAALTPPVPFTPAVLPNLDLWFRADLGVTQTLGVVSAWANQGLTGAAQNASQGTVGNRPVQTLSNAAFNNQATIDFDASLAQRLVGTGYTTSGNYELYIVFKIAADPPATAATCGLMFFGGPASTSYNPFTDGVIYDGNLRTGNIATVNPATSMTTKSLYTVTSDASNWKNFLNGTLLSTKALAFAFPTSAASFILGGSTAGAYMNGSIAEILGVNGTTSPANLALLKGYINTRYAMAVV